MFPSRKASTLDDILQSNDEDLLFTEPCRTEQPHMLYGDTHVPVTESPVGEPSLTQEIETSQEEPASIEIAQQKNQDLEASVRSILEILSQGLVQELETRVNAGFNVNEIDDSIGLYPIHFVAASGNLELVKVLVERGNANVDIKNSENEVHTLQLKRSK
jgi:ankyrin repeat protein